MWCIQATQSISIRFHGLLWRCTGIIQTLFYVSISFYYSVTNITVVLCWAFLVVSFVLYCLSYMTFWYFYTHSPNQSLGPCLLLSYVCRPGILNPLQNILILPKSYCAPEHVCDFPYVWLCHSKGYLCFYGFCFITVSSIV